MSAFKWRAAGLADDLAGALRVLGGHYPLAEVDSGPTVEFVHTGAAGTLEVAREGDAYTIRYGRLADALRGVGTALAGLSREGSPVQEQTPFKNVGIMLDCSRNAVMTVEHFEKWLRYLALLGYNTAMLYTEDTYEIDGEPLFGIFRGRYSKSDLKRLDAYAASLGIELIGCIQTLGHLEQILHWGAYGPVKDTGSVLLVDEPATEQLIGRMLDTWSECLRSRRIHVGMDETHDLGRGKFLDRSGWERPFDVFNRHLGRVMKLARERGLSPMIWSDMYFRLGSKNHEYYDLEAVIPDDVKAAVPEDVGLVYWDYYHRDEETYLKMIERHKEFGRPLLMAGGIWTWNVLWYDREKTEATTRPCVAACRKTGIDDITFTMWGDDGGFCEYESSVAGLVFAADEVYGGSDPDALKARFEAITGGDSDATMLAASLADNTLGGRTQGFTASSLLWDDPLQAIYLTHWRHADIPRESIRDYYRAVSELLETHAGKTAPVDLDHALTLARYLSAKIDFRLLLEEAHSSTDREAARALAGVAEQMAALANELCGTFRRQWHARNRPQGFESIQSRMAAQSARYMETAKRLLMFARGDEDSLPEVAEGMALDKDAAGSMKRGGWRNLASATCIH